MIRICIIEDEKPIANLIKLVLHAMAISVPVCMTELKRLIFLIVKPLILCCLISCCPAQMVILCLNAVLRYRYNS